MAIRSPLILTAFWIAARVYALRVLAMTIIELIQYFPGLKRI